MMAFRIRNKRVFIAGHNGMVGSALVRMLADANCSVITVDRRKLDLSDQLAVRTFIARERPDAVIIAAARVGGIHANSTLPADFSYENLAIQTNLIEASHRNDVEKLLFLGSSCIYPRDCLQPISEDYLLSGPLEPTNEWYAIAKIAGIKLCQAYRRQHGRDFITCQPTNLYGPNDNFNLAYSHVLPALLRKAHDAKCNGTHDLVVWGTGRPRREFLHVDDFASACIFLLENFSDETPLNVGVGWDITIAELAKLVADVVGFEGDLVYDQTMPDGTPRKLLDIRRISALGWKPQIELRPGLESYYRWFLENVAYS